MKNLNSGGVSSTFMHTSSLKAMAKLSCAMIIRAIRDVAGLGGTTLNPGDTGWERRNKLIKKSEAKFAALWFEGNFEAKLSFEECVEYINTILRYSPNVAEGYFQGDYLSAANFLIRIKESPFSIIEALRELQEGEIDTMFCASPFEMEHSAFSPITTAAGNAMSRSSVSVLYS
ncbi:MAG: hypothetical protein GY729_05670 [Desulfobacteraceae bacterium]|nr:hypothetical protein [Desulfobacteraceae bacterium]